MVMRSITAVNTQKKRATIKAYLVDTSLKKISN